MEKNTTVVFPAPMMSAIGELGNFLARETAAAQGIRVPQTTEAALSPPPTPSAAANATNGDPTNGPDLATTAVR